MSNFTLSISVLSTLYLVTKNDIKCQQEELSLTQEEIASFEDTFAVLNTLHYTPRNASLRLIYDHAAKS